MSLGLGSIVSVGGGPGSSGGSTSGLISINSQTGPFITVNGVNGIDVTSGGNVITVNGAALSGLSPTKFSATFTSITSGIFTHNFSTLSVLVQVYGLIPRRAILPDKIIVENLNQISIVFNAPQSGYIVIL